MVVDRDRLRRYSRHHGDGAALPNSSTSSSSGRKVSENGAASQRHGRTSAISRRYRRGIASFAAIWLYVLVAPMTFLEGGYPNWVVKQGFIASCDLGELPVFGDSRAEAAIDPGTLHIDTRNLTLGAVSPVETYFFIRAALRCPRPPSRVVLSFSTPSFDVDRSNVFLWENAVRAMGYLSYADLREIESYRAAHLGDPSIDQVRAIRIGAYGRRSGMHCMRSAFRRSTSTA